MIMLLNLRHSSKEKRDVDELEAEGSSTRQLFLEAGSLEEAKAKEMQEYLDAKNKEVRRTQHYIWISISGPIHKLESHISFWIWKCRSIYVQQAMYLLSPDLCD